MWVLVGTILATGQFADLPVHYPSREACEVRISYIQQTAESTKWKFNCYKAEGK